MVPSPLWIYIMGRELQSHGPRLSDNQKWIKIKQPCEEELKKLKFSILQKYSIYLRINARFSLNSSNFFIYYNDTERYNFEYKLQKYFLWSNNLRRIDQFYYSEGRFGKTQHLVSFILLYLSTTICLQKLRRKHIVGQTWQLDCNETWFEL